VRVFCVDKFILVVLEVIFRGLVVLVVEVLEVFVDIVCGWVSVVVELLWV